MAKFADLTGLIFNDLTVVGEAGSDGKNRLWHCLCVCGTRIVQRSSHLTSGHSKSCGCGRASRVAPRIEHGLSKHPLYRVWCGMRQRCEDPNEDAFPRYGGRGIKVCERWWDFRNFAEDMGSRPIGMTLERRDTDGDYSPNNCTWATPKEQARNRRATLRINGRPLAQVADDLGIPYKQLYYQFKKGALCSSGLIS